jgi:hypothetical protein
MSYDDLIFYDVFALRVTRGRSASGLEIYDNMASKLGAVEQGGFFQV